MFRNPLPQQIASLLRAARIIAIESRRGAGSAALRLPHHSPFVESILGQPAVSSLDQLPEVLGSEERVDLVDVFRRAEHIAGIVSDCIRLRLPALWLQEGVVDEAAATRAVQAGIFTVMDRCLFSERAALR
ncbi:MAG TPA: CoA-binding protein [Steroidobacteraceae bacterium]|nr:CoA-binding protein [Steroidobacteraceae bacterium]